MPFSVHAVVTSSNLLFIFQTRPVPFSVHAVVTSSDLEFDRKDLDFGHCTIHEAVKTTVQLTNKSVLSQPYGFVGIPDVSTLFPT